MSYRVKLDLSRNGRARLTELCSAVGNGGFVGAGAFVPPCTTFCATTFCRLLAARQVRYGKTFRATKVVVGVYVKVQCPAESLCARRLYAVVGCPMFQCFVFLRVVTVVLYAWLMAVTSGRVWRHLVACFKQTLGACDVLASIEP